MTEKRFRKHPSGPRGVSRTVHKGSRIIGRALRTAWQRIEDQHELKMIELYLFQCADLVISMNTLVLTALTFSF